MCFLSSFQPCRLTRAFFASWGVANSQKAKPIVFLPSEAIGMWKTLCSQSTLPNWDTILRTTFVSFSTLVVGTLGSPSITITFDIDSFSVGRSASVIASASESDTSPDSSMPSTSSAAIFRSSSSIAAISVSICDIVMPSAGSAAADIGKKKKRREKGGAFEWTTARLHPFQHG